MAQRYLYRYEITTMTGERVDCAGVFPGIEEFSAFAREGKRAGHFKKATHQETFVVEWPDADPALPSRAVRFPYGEPVVVDEYDAQERAAQPISLLTLISMGFTVDHNIRHYGLPIAFPLSHQPSLRDLYEVIKKDVLEKEQERIMERVRKLLFADDPW